MTLYSHCLYMVYVLAMVCLIGTDTRAGNSDSCGYQACNLGKDGRLNVHLVTHTHTDPGWLITADQYYYQQVQYILDSVISELLADPDKRFNYVEMSFFTRWWHEQNDYIRHAVTNLVNEGRLEFVMGGWVMNDEATTHYTATIDQHTAGFAFLEQTFGHCARPKIGWQIDPFGHSREQVSLFAQYGFDAMFIGRLDYQDKDQRKANKTMELVSFGSQNLGDQASLFTGINYNGYEAPTGFCFDEQCSDPPIKDDDMLEDYNVDERVRDFLDAVHEQAGHYSTDHILVLMGSDYQYQNAHMNFKNIDKLIKYVNAKEEESKVHVFYSSPSCYLYALNKIGQTYTKKDDDFMPYASRANTFWTGYFTSRPAIKRYVRETNNFFQTTKQLNSLALLGVEHGSGIKIDVLRHAMAVSQTHDAVSGTEKQVVAYDFAKRLGRGVASCQEVVNSAYSKLLPLAEQTAPDQVFCELLNSSFCAFTENTQDPIVVNVYNPLGWNVTFWVRLPVAASVYTVIGPDRGKSVDNQVVPLSAETKNLPDHKGSKATGELVFQTVLPALGFAAYIIQPAKAGQDKTVVMPHSNEDFTIKNEHLSLTFDGTTGLLREMSNLNKGLTHSVSQTLLHYTSADGNNSEPQFQASGAYIFRPEEGTDVKPIASTVKIERVAGTLVQEVRQVFNEWASQVIRLYKGEKFAEFEWTVGPIPYEDKVGKEVISRFTTDLKSRSTFYTDSNGREVLKRVRNFRPTWKLNQTEPIAGNYYPVNSRIYITDPTKSVQFTVLTDRSQGGSSIRDGEVELMVHRRLFVDDNFGVGEALNETGITGRGLVVRGKHYVSLDTTKDSGRLHRSKARTLFGTPTMSFSKLEKLAVEMYNTSFRTHWSGLKKELPENVHLLSLEQWKADRFLLRLEHFYERSEDPVLSKPATVSLKGLFEPFEVKSVVELTLGANQLLDEAQRLQWHVEDYGTTRSDMYGYVSPVIPATLDVLLQPMQIRTFEVQT